MLKRSVLHVDGRFDFEAGGHLDSMDLAYYAPDREYVPGELVVWVCHALTGNANPEDWWPEMVGPGKLFDPDRMFVVCSSMLCSPYGACSPATINPETGKPYLLDFPKTTVRDIVNAHIIVRKHLGIEKIDLMLGPSIGGFQTVEWLAMEPEMIGDAVILATSVRALPYMSAFNESQRMAFRSDPTFLEAKDIHGGEKALMCARSMALISYRTYMGYNLTQAETDDDTLFADRASSYQRYQGQKLVNRDFDAYGYWYLTYALDSMNVGRGRGGVARALGNFKARCTVISITSDQIFPPAPLKEAAELIPDATYHEIDSIFGHDGFLIENDRLTAILEPLLDRISNEKNS